MFLEYCGKRCILLQSMHQSELDVWNYDFAVTHRPLYLWITCCFLFSVCGSRKQRKFSVFFPTYNPCRTIFVMHIRCIQGTLKLEILVFQYRSFRQFLIKCHLMKEKLILTVVWYRKITDDYSKVHYKCCKNLNYLLISFCIFSDKY